MNGVIRQGFTLIELMVVLVILSVLVALSMVGLSIVRSSASDTQTANALRQLGFAWVQYSADSKGRFVPGFVNADIQNKMKMAAAYPDHNWVSPAPTFEQDLPNIGGPWVWRLVQYLGGELETILPPDMRDLLPLSDYPAHGAAIANQPQFAYNGWYVGGHWSMAEDMSRPLLAYRKARLRNRSRLDLVSESLGEMKHPSRIAVFMPGLLVPTPGAANIDMKDVTSWFEVTPPVLAEEVQWMLVGDGAAESVIFDAMVPSFGPRHDTPVYHADGHIERVPSQKLRDQARWIDAAKEIDGVPARDFTHEPD